jgi:hypothetical protein
MSLKIAAQPVASLCICSRNPVLCGASEQQHECICQKLVNGNQALGKDIKCRFQGQHPCMCKVNPFSCRALVSEHDCMCRVTPSNCRTLARHDCICQSVGSDKCLSNSVHQCVCPDREPGVCRATESHRCCCQKFGPSKCQANVHTGVAPGQGPVQTNVFIQGPVFAEQVNIVEIDRSEIERQVFSVTIDPVRLYRPMRINGIHPTTTVAEIKNMISQQTSLNYSEIALRFKSTVLSDQSTVGEYGIKDESRIQMSW